MAPEIDIVAQRGSYVVLRHDKERGRIFDARTRRLFPPTPLVAIMARGYWEPFSGDRQSVAEALTDAQHLSADDAGQASFELRSHEQPDPTRQSAAAR